MEFKDECPFCGNRNETLDHSDDGSGYWNRCQTCGATGPVGSSAHMAITKWSERREAKAREKPTKSAYERRKHLIN